ncbi:MAG: tail protein X [Aeromonas popoffii]|uniref:tail protein X n=1 Tax=Aeromonas popoffii TaxID=70856 RepID=UPI003F2C6C84
MSKELTYIYTTKDGDMLDEITFLHYGEHVPMQMVMNANPGLSKLGARLPAELEVRLPPKPAITKKMISLWGES